MCSAVGTGTGSLFGNNQNKLGTTLGTLGTFGATGFSSGTNSLGFGAAAQPVGKRHRETDKPQIFIHYAWGESVYELIFFRSFSNVDPWLRYDLSSCRPQLSQILMRPPPSRPCCSSSSAFWRIHLMETRRFSEISCQIPKRKRR